jgi:hypothetical protein
LLSISSDFAEVSLSLGTTLKALKNSKTGQPLVLIVQQTAPIAAKKG